MLFHHVDKRGRNPRDPADENARERDDDSQDSIAFGRDSVEIDAAHATLREAL
jgi:hypothetical protein